MADGDEQVPDPFAGLPMFAEMAKAMAGHGPLNWDIARQFALMAASGGTAEPNVDPVARIRLEELARIVGLHVADLTSTDLTFPPVSPVTRTAWALRALDDYRPLFTDLATSLGRATTTDAPPPVSRRQRMREVENHPLVAQAKQMFDADVVDVQDRKSTRLNSSHRT